MEMSDERYLNIIDIARKAGKILLRFYEKGNKTLSIENKNKDLLDFVTRADKEADFFICSEILKLFPNDKIISEESFVEEASFSGNAWFVDPLDGTKEFMFEGGRFSVMIGLCINGIPTFGVVYNPLEDITYIGERGQGSFYKLPGTDWLRLQVSKISNLGESTQVIRRLYDEKRDGDNFINSLSVKNNIHDASFGLRFGRIANGEAEFTINTNRRVSKWDTCAPQVILEEAGGRITDIFGEELNYKNPGIRWTNSFIASNKLFHNDIVLRCKKLAVLWGLISESK
jgi:3'(2'), 5'-bisphosphate nucleotidase